jgi:hypothetical protein
MPENEAGLIIDLDQAKMYTYAFQESHPDQIVAFKVSIDKIQAIIDQPDCKGVRIYNGFDKENDKKNLILIGYDHDDKDMEGGVIVEKLLACPPYCGHHENALVRKADTDTN